MPFSTKNIKLLCTITISFIVVLLFSLFTNTVDKKKDIVSLKLNSFQQNLTNHSEHAVLSSIEYHFTAVTRGISQKEFTNKRFFIAKTATKRNSIVNEKRFSKYISLTILDSHILIGKLNLLKIIFPFHQFW